MGKEMGLELNDYIEDKAGCWVDIGGTVTAS